MMTEMSRCCACVDDVDGGHRLAGTPLRSSSGGAESALVVNIELMILAPACYSVDCSRVLDSGFH